MDRRREYEKLLDEARETLSRSKDLSTRVAILRALLFIAAIVLIFVLVPWSPTAGIVIPLILFSLFLYFVRRSVEINQKIRFEEQMIRVFEEEIEWMDWNFESFPEGKEYIDFDHPYSYDLDLFGKHSIYRMLCRAGTVAGRRALANQLKNPLREAGEIQERQQAIRELADEAGWRHEFLATSRLVDESEDSSGLLENWLSAPDRYAHKPVLAQLINGVSLVSILLPFLIIFGVLHYAFIVYYILPISITLFETRAINQEQSRVSKLLKLFRKYQALIARIERKNFVSTVLLERKERLIKNKRTASILLKELSGIIWGLDMRLNLLVAGILNAFVLWDIRLVRRLEIWRKNYGGEFKQWIGVIAEFESMNSLATFTWNRKDLHFPEVVDGPFMMNIQGGGHPMILPGKRVDNDIELTGPGQLFLITGANMAGKSTLLRTVGVNLVLGMIGAPVCAREMRMAPVQIMTSVRTNDSLGDDESYFYAELKRLSLIISRLEDEGSMFVIIDEMLKGTNSRDKHIGSEGLIRRLIGLKAVGLLATHDVELGRLTGEFPHELHPRCFEVAIEGDQLKFDYQLINGISKSLNATFLMKKMGIINEPT